MKKLILLLVVAIAPLCAGSLSRGERDFAMSHLHASRKMLLDAVAGLSEAQWRFKPAVERWSIAECAEHIALSEDSLFQLVTDKIMKSEAVPASEPPSRDKDQAVIERIRDRSEKASAPEFLKPSGRWTTREAVIEDFKKSRDRTIAFVENTQDDLRGHSMHNMDAYQWLLMISAHTERHIAQINEVKADPDFPRN